MLQRILELFIIIDPFCAIPLFLAFSVNLSLPEQRVTAFRSSVALFVGGTLFALFGTMLLSAFAVPLPAFSAVGGFVLMVIGFSLMQLSPSKLKSEQHEHYNLSQLWIVPITFPMLLGPASINTLMADTNKLQSISALAIISMVTYATFVAVIAIQVRLKTDTFFQVFLSISERLIGMLVCSLGVATIVSSAKQLLL